MPEKCWRSLRSHTRLQTRVLVLHRAWLGEIVEVRDAHLREKGWEDDTANKMNGVLEQSGYLVFLAASILSSGSSMLRQDKTSIHYAAYHDNIQILRKTWRSSGAKRMTTPPRSMRRATLARVANISLNLRVTRRAGSSKLSTRPVMQFAVVKFHEEYGRNVHGPCTSGIGMCRSLSAKAALSVQGNT